MTRAIADRKTRRPAGHGWTQAMRCTVLRAAAAAGWNDAQRYIAMRHAGCPIEGRAGRPSIKHPRNTFRQFVLVMELAEAQALMRGASVRGPKNFATWRDAAADESRPHRDLARRIAAEAIRRMPGRFRFEGHSATPESETDRLLRAAVLHVTRADSEELPTNARPQSIDECDAAQTMRVVESLRQWIGRELLERGLTPESFDAPGAARRRAEARRKASR